MSIGNKITELRKNNGLSQEQLAEKIGVTRQTISKWELDETSPDIKQAKELSNVFNVSLDDLTNNDINNVLIKKVSNTENLAGIIIKILKVFGVLLIGFIVFMIIATILFTVVRKEPSSSTLKNATMNCSIKDNNYIITIGDNNYFKCTNCDKKMNVYLNDITDWSNIEHSIQNVNKYFENNGGSCIYE